MSAVNIGGQFVQQIPLVGHSLGPQVPEMMMRIADGKLRFEGSFRG